VKSVNADSADAPPIAADKSASVSCQGRGGRKTFGGVIFTAYLQAFIGGNRRGIGGIGVLPFLNP
jgi:hypothetical protein